MNSVIDWTCVGSCCHDAGTHEWSLDEMSIFHKKKKGDLKAGMANKRANSANGNAIDPNPNPGKKLMFSPVVFFS